MKRHLHILKRWGYSKGSVGEQWGLVFLECLSQIQHRPSVCQNKSLAPLPQKDLDIQEC